MLVLIQVFGDLVGVSYIERNNRSLVAKNVLSEARGVPKVLQNSQIYNHLIFSGLQTCYRTQDRLISE